MRPRIVILGPGGAGKSTLARELAATLDLPVIHLDPLYWQLEFVERPWHDMVALARKAAEETDAWVIEGPGIDAAVPLADVVVFLDLPRWRYILRFGKRWLRWRLLRSSVPGPDRPPWGETLRPAIWTWVWTWDRDERPKVLALVEAACKAGQEVVWLRTPGEVRRFMEAVT